MKSRILSACLLAALSLAGTHSFARALENGPSHAATGAAYKTEANDCTLPTSQFSIDINNVRATLLTAGDMWFDVPTSSAAYEVPKGARGVANAQAIYAGAIWVSGLDQGNNLKIAALTYRQNGGSDYYSGPLDNNGTTTLATCRVWDQHFPVWASQIKPFVAQYQVALSAAGGNPANVSISISTVSDSIKYWPAKGNPYLAAKGYDVSGILAPFYDADGDGNYDPAHGDYPTIKQGGINPRSFDGYCGNPKTDDLTYTKNNAYADEMVFWVTNDKGGVHNGTSSGAPIGIQINNLAFAFQSSDEINSMTFYTYNILNKSGAVLNKTYMSQYVDPDLGCPYNDRVGCDTSRSIGIMYNGVPQNTGNTPGYSYVCDLTGSTACSNGTIGYGCDLPMLGVDFFEGPVDTITYPNPANPSGPRIHRQLGMTAFESYTNSNTATGDPVTSVQFRNYQTGKWKDGTPVTWGGNGYQNSPQQTPFMYPGDPSIATQWSECNPQVGAPIYAYDRRFVQTSGPFTFLPCASQTITIGVVFVQPTGGVGSNCPSWSFISTADDKAQALFDAGFKQLEGPSAPKLSIRELNKKVIINVEDDPLGNNVGESYAQIDPLRVRKGFISGVHKDSLYRYQGYIVYQLIDASVSANDLTNPSKAIPVAVYDIQDNIKHVANWSQVLDPATGVSLWTSDNSTVPGVGTDLPNLGIRHSFVDSLDFFGGGQMVNHQTYYFGVISFATNNFKTFRPDSGIGQYAPFLIGKNFNKYSAIPSDPTAEDGGTVLHSAWGGSSLVQRLEGQGNGGNFVDLTPATIDKIMNSPSFAADTLDYTTGYDPIGLKIIDPLLLKAADFELKIHDTVAYNGVSVSTLAWWELNDLTNNKIIHSVRTLDRPYEQIIADSAGNDYGFSITLGTPFPIYINYLDSLPVYGAITGSISFQDSTKPWLSFVKDTSVSADVKNWIRSGQNYITCTVPSGTPADPLCNVFSDAYYYTGGTDFHFSDPNNAFDKIAGGTWAPYCLTPNWSASDRPTIISSQRPATVGGPAFKWNRYDDRAYPPRNNLDKLQSVDVVITSDTSKWTRCVVFETGENPQGAALDPNSTNKAPRKGMLRGHYSVHKDGTEDQSTLGISYFPGYAINIETGQRLEMAFGEASDERDQNGSDMVWNPSSQVLGVINNGNASVPNAPFFGGRHFIYVLDYPYQPDVVQPGDRIWGTLGDPLYYASMVNNPYNQAYRPDVISIYDHIMWTSIPYLTPGYTMKSMANGLIPDDNTVTIKLRVQKPYAKYATNATPADGDSLPRYKFSTKGQVATVQNDSVAKSALDMIRIVPNPYYAYSSYETGANDTRVKITNLPNECTVRIYTLDGQLVRTLGRSVSNINPVSNKPVKISDGYDLEDKTQSNIDNTLDWDLKNSKNISVASGIYLFDISAPGIGHKILKWFGAMRPTDISNF
ncbi:MAG: hypothetical protein JSS76_14400 [Bacteroidetes bacterium]|nr:hypothetical protein [Bacteroidota bacterium]